MKTRHKLQHPADRWQLLLGVILLLGLSASILVWEDSKTFHLKAHSVEQPGGCPPAGQSDDGWTCFVSSGQTIDVTARTARSVEVAMRDMGLTGGRPDSVLALPRPGQPDRYVIEVNYLEDITNTITGSFLFLADDSDLTLISDASATTPYGTVMNLTYWNYDLLGYRYEDGMWVLYAWRDNTLSRSHYRRGEKSLLRSTDDGLNWQTIAYTPNDDDPACPHAEFADDAYLYKLDNFFTPLYRCSIH